jgi:hypothetical protein
MSRFSTAFSCLILSMAIAVTGASAPAIATAQSVVPEVAASAGSDPLAIGRVIMKPQTLQYDRAGLVNKAAGTPSEAAFAKYGGDMEAYSRAAQKSRTGKAFEAVFASQENARFAAIGAKNRILVSAAENLPHHGADLVMIDEAGRVTRQFQAKTGWQNLQQAVSDPRYAKMEIVTDDESLAVLSKELAKAESNAARRGLGLAGEWKAVRRAIDEGRLLQRTPSGAPLPTKGYVEQEARSALEAAWKRTSGAAAETAGSARPLEAAARVERAGVAAADGAHTAEGIARAAAREAGDVALATRDAGSGAAKAAEGAAEAASTGSKALRGVGTGLVVVGVAVDVGTRVNKGVNVEKRYAAGEITAQEREVAHAKNAAGCAGGWGGAWAGAELGAMGGGAVAGPVGAGVGGVAGGVAGYFGGEAVAEEAAEWTVDAIHSTGTTISEATSSAWSWVCGN